MESRGFCTVFTFHQCYQVTAPCHFLLSCFMARNYPLTGSQVLTSCPSAQTSQPVCPWPRLQTALSLQPVCVLFPNTWCADFSGEDLHGVWPSPAVFLHWIVECSLKNRSFIYDEKLGLEIIVTSIESCSIWVCWVFWIMWGQCEIIPFIFLLSKICSIHTYFMFR